MEDGGDLSCSFRSDIVSTSNSTISSTTSDMVTVNSSMTSAAIDHSDDENDEALLALIDQKRRIVAELSAASEFDFEDVPGPLQDYQNGELGDDDGAIDDCSSQDFSEPSAIHAEDALENGLDYALMGETDALDDDDGDEEPYSFDEDFDDEEVDKLLEQTFANGLPAPDSQSSSALSDQFSGLSQLPSVKPKVVLKHRGMEYFEVLPEGWIEVTHTSGVPVYLHKATRVCSLARPYFLGPGSVRNHDVPISAVPCYYQRKVKELEERERRVDDVSGSTKSELSDEMNSLDDTGPPTCKKMRMPAVKVQTAEDFKKQNLNAHQLREYCSPIFEFETINVIRFKSWSDHRAYRKLQRQQHMTSSPNVSAKKLARRPIQNGDSLDDNISSRPSLPSNVKLITVPDMERGTKPQQKPFFLNPQGRTSIAVLHEYVQKVMKGSVSYEFSETRNAANPYRATVRIATSDRNRSADGGNVKGPSEQVWTEYGKGEGNSKKNAKLTAAKHALQVLVPGIEFNAEGVADSPVEEDDAGKLFDLIKITDSRVPELSSKAGQPTPFVILQECLKRHSSFGDTTIDMNIERLKHQQHKFTMRVAKHQVEVQCTNKKEGKQRAAQAMLEKLHPQITSWGSLIRLYGYGAQRQLQETRKAKDSIIRLQPQNNKQNYIGEEPNMAILEKLKQEMEKLYDGESGVKIGAPASDGNSARGISNVKRINL